MSEPSRRPTAAEAAQSLREVADRRQQVRGTPPPPWLYVTVWAALPAIGVATDLWPHGRQTYGSLLEAWVLAYLLLPYVPRIGSRLGHHVMPTLSTGRAGVGRRWIGLAVGLTVYAAGDYLAEQLKPPFPHTIVTTTIALLMIAGRRWMYPTDATHTTVDDAA